MKKLYKTRLTME